MELTPTLDASRFDLDGAYLPGGDQTAELADSFPAADWHLRADADDDEVTDQLDASIFMALLHP
jgi:hypothetical protein